MTKKKGTGTNSNFNKAKREKNDEFYTRLTDIENELCHYKDHFKNKIIYCNCDDPYRSNFVKYFALNFKFLGLKQLIATCYKHPDVDDSQFEGVADRPIKWVYNGEQIEGQNYPDLSKAIVTDLKSDGDFRSEECLDILKDCDIVVTNPPFSLFRDFISLMEECNKSFLIIGNQNAITYKEAFSMFMNNKIWLGYGFKGGAGHFINEHYEDYATATDRKEGMIRVSGVHWFTNLDISKRHEDLILYKQYNSAEYPKYDNFDAINIDKVKEIPCDYKGLMGVPITFMNKFNPKQFDLIDNSNNLAGDIIIKGKLKKNPGRFYINGKRLYERLIIRNRKPQLD